MTIRIALLALLSHWRKKPGQLLTLIIGLSLATALWSGVQAINAEARASYARASAILGENNLASLVPVDGSTLPLATFIRLQKSGWRTSPVLEGRMRAGSRSIRVIGIEPLTAPAGLAGRAMEAGNGPALNLSAFLTRPGQIRASQKTADLLTDLPDLPPMIVSEQMSDGALLTDIGVAERLLKKSGRISRLLVLPGQRVDRLPLSEAGPGLKLVEPQTESDVSKLTDSFHLNLTAFGLLSFVVGLFIVHGTVGLAFEQRRGMFRTLRTMGLSARHLTVAMVIELLGFALLAGSIGVTLGYVIAASLLPGVAATLRGLYGAEVAGALTFRFEWWAAGLVIALLGTAIAAAGSLLRLWRLPILASAQPRAWAMISGSAMKLQAIAALVLLLLMAMLIGFGSGLVVSFAVLGSMLLGASLALPGLFSMVLWLGQRMARTPLAQWFWADTRQQMPGLSLALMALLLALSANIGVSTMVGSFRTTFTAWLDQRLASEIYVTARDEKQAERLRAWLETRSDAVLPIWSVKLDLAGQPGQLFGIADHATYREKWPLIEKQSGVWDDVAGGAAVLVNEQLSIREQVRTGDLLTLAPGRSLRIAGIYSDYGNPAPQVMVSLALLTKWYPEVSRLRYGVRIEPAKAPALISEIREEFQLDERSLVEQATIKAFSVRVFEQTFAVTDALNVLTLAIAGFAIFTSLLTLATMRLPQLAPVWAMGLTRRKIAVMELLRALLLAVLTALVALPVGLALAWALLALVNVEAFGWRLPMNLFPADWFRLGLFALLATLLAAAIPAWRLSRIAPAELVKVFTNER